MKDFAYDTENNIISAYNIEITNIDLKKWWRNEKREKIK